MQQIFDLASVALFDLLVIASNRGATCHVAKHQEQDVEGEEEVGHGRSITRDVAVDEEQADQQQDEREKDDEAHKVVEGHGSLLGTCEHANKAVYSQAASDEAQNEDEEGHGGSVLKQGAKSPEEAGQSEKAHEAQYGEGGGGHGLCLGTRSASLNERLERHLAFGEVAHGEHEFRRNAVIRHLGDAARRDAESICERFGPAALRFEPSFEIHGASLEQPKRLSQGFSKP
jgi:hypothetical protein